MEDTARHLSRLSADGASRSHQPDPQHRHSCNDSRLADDDHDSNDPGGWLRKIATATPFACGRTAAGFTNQTRHRSAIVATIAAGGRRPRQSTTLGGSEIDEANATAPAIRSRPLTHEGFVVYRTRQPRPSEVHGHNTWAELAACSAERANLARPARATTTFLASLAVEVADLADGDDTQASPGGGAAFVAATWVVLASSRPVSPPTRRR